MKYLALSANVPRLAAYDRFVSIKTAFRTLFRQLFLYALSITIRNVPCELFASPVNKEQ